MLNAIFQWSCLAAGLLGCVGLGWCFRWLREEREERPRAALSGPQLPDVDGVPPFTDPPPDSDVDEDTAAWLASLHDGFMDAYRADEALVRQWIECGCIGPMPEAPSWDEDELVLRGLIMSRAEMLAAESELFDTAELAAAR